MTVREKQRALTDEQLRFLDESPFVGVATTLRDDGSPHSTVVWVDVEPRRQDRGRGRSVQTGLKRRQRNLEPLFRPPRIVAVRIAAQEVAVSLGCFVCPR